MDSSYEFKLLDDIKNGDIIDIGFIITLKNSDRNYKKELEYFNPCKKVIIVYNNFGYLDNNKELCKKNYIFDLIYSYYMTFKYSLHNYPNKNILILEDDFIWNKNINLENHLNIINKFLKNKNNYCYNLGCLPFFGMKYNNTHSLMKLVAGNQSVIYHPESIKKFVEKYESCKCSIICIEKFLCNNSNYFIYKKPLTYQYWGDIKDKKKTLYYNEYGCFQC